MYGTTEIGVILVSYPGADGLRVQARFARQADSRRHASRCRIRAAQPCPPGVVGELKVWRRDGWVATKDLGRVDEDGYFFHGGRADDVIISAGWTMSAVEIEDAILKHPDVREAAAIGVPDELRGQVVKAFVVQSACRRRCLRQGDPGPRAHPPQPARVSAPRRLRRRAAEARRPARSTARSCASRKLLPQPRQPHAGNHRHHSLNHSIHTSARAKP